MQNEIFKQLRNVQIKGEIALLNAKHIFRAYGVIVVTGNGKSTNPVCEIF
jgi:hypothetical protein